MQILTANRIADIVVARLEYTNSGFQTIIMKYFAMKLWSRDRLWRIMYVEDSQWGKESFEAIGLSFPRARYVTWRKSIVLKREGPD